MSSCEHVTIFVDESGDLGFSSKSIRRSPIFVVAYLVPTNRERLEIDMKRFIRRKIRMDLPELKFHRDSDEVKEKVLKFLSKVCLFEAGYVAIDKNAVKKELREKQSVLYNYLTVHYVLTPVIKVCSPKRINYVIDRSLSGSRKKEFDKYMREKTIWLALKDAPRAIPFKPEDFVELPDVVVNHEDSQKECCLQIADYLAGSVSRAYKRDLKYYSLISGKFRDDWKNTWGLQKI